MGSKQAPGVNNFLKLIRHPHFLFGIGEYASLKRESGPVQFPGSRIFRSLFSQFTFLVTVNAGSVINKNSYSRQPAHAMLHHLNHLHHLHHLFFLLLLLLLHVHPSSASTEKFLLDHLLSNYSSYPRPVKNVRAS